jgi:hypothetical protein
MADLLISKQMLPAGKKGSSKGPLAFALKMSNFGINFWRRVTLVKLLKGGYLLRKFQLWGRKRPQTLLRVYFMDSHLVIRTTADYFDHALFGIAIVRLNLIFCKF